MTISTLVDSNVFIDILGTGPLQDAALDLLREAMASGPIILSSIVWAELAFTPLPEEQLFRAIAWMRPKRETLPFEAAYPAGQAHRLYRERGGRRDRTLPDFLIGAHALAARHRLLTRDASRYRAYFPDLTIICPETHP
ncbi:type II toxin-antitoxin system VapC family toxin [Aureimonas sp. AU40]|uniref:type II toxin-antitoxin system VapC family toxin n=1 Tax=Aureimonas sp. AU40 TaxID=1637747 RepID=UPI0007841193|nr:type II toxin-antitoxin system VapC family toxin [Aureimonas sp. AU40]